MVNPGLARTLARRLMLIIAAVTHVMHCTQAADAYRAARAPRIPRFQPIPRFQTSRRPNPSLGVQRNLLSQCQQRWRNATLDHFNWGPNDNNATTFRQRYFVCGEHWRSPLANKACPGPIFFYLGNEADVTLYLNNTGLMWESAPQFSALLVFAEHRYYGQSLPFGEAVRQHMRYLSAEQAMADYAELLAELKAELGAPQAPVIGFGGSYGGMLAAWMRLKYPHVLQGAVAASAPIWNFMGDVPAFDPLAFSKGVTFDATAAGGAAPACADNVRSGWQLLQRLAGSPEGRARLSAGLGLCPSAAVESQDDADALRDWLAGAWDYMAMGNFPYESGYILNGQGMLPAFPVREACSRGLQQPHPTEEQLLTGMREAAAVYYNYSGALDCLDWQLGANEDSDQDADFWGYQYCTEMFMPFAKDGVADMFWAEPWDPDAAAAACEASWGVAPRRHWATTQWGGHRIDAASNIVFTNGLLDPWHGGGVLRSVSPSLPALIIPEGAHHLDLMFSHPKDPASVVHARSTQRSLIRLWVAEACPCCAVPAPSSDQR